jgi:hypothetical protein
VVLGEAKHEIVEESAIEVLATKELVADVGADFVNTAAHLQQREVEGATTQVKDGDALGTMLTCADAMGQGCRDRVRNDPHHLESGQTRRIPKGNPLGIGKRERCGEDGSADGLA